MKRIIVFAIVLALVLSLFAGCGSKEPESISGSISSNPPASTPAPDKDTPEEPSQQENEVLAQEDEKEFDTGVVIGGTYSNEFLGINCTLDSGWVFFDKDQITEISGLAAGSIDDDDIKAQFESSGVICDMYASAIDGSATINIAIEDLGLVYGSVLSESAYSELSAPQLPPVMEAMGMTDIVCETTTVEFCGENHSAVRAKARNAGIDVFETIVCVKAGKYMACITICSFGEDKYDEFSDCFYTGEPRPAEEESTQAPGLDTTASEVEAGEFSVGMSDGNAYVNEFLGIRCDVPDGWVFIDNATLASYNGVSGSYNTEAALALFDQGLTPYDMEASSEDGYYSMNLIYERLSDAFAATLSTEDYMDIALSQVGPAFEAAGYTDVVYEKTAVEFCGETHVGAKVTANVGGFTIYETIVVIKAGNYMACITLVSLAEDAGDTLSSFFSKIS